MKFAYAAERDDELSLVKGTRVTVMEKCSDGWWRGGQAGRVGWFPSNYVLEELGGAEEGEDGDPPLVYQGGSPGTLLANGRAGGGGAAAVLHLVQTLYPFSSVTEEELNFEKGEVMEVVEKPENDPEWWRCQNSRGMVGLVPKNYVVVLDERPGPPPSSASFLQNRLLAPARSGKFGGRDWYYGGITRHQAESVLNERGEEGDFLVRDSESSVSLSGICFGKWRLCFIVTATFPSSDWMLMDTSSKRSVHFPQKNGCCIAMMPTTVTLKTIQNKY